MLEKCNGSSGQCYLLLLKMEHKKPILVLPEPGNDGKIAWKVLGRAILLMATAPYFYGSILLRALKSKIIL
jgi:hypothetical protein